MISFVGVPNYTRSQNVEGEEEGAGCQRPQRVNRSCPWALIMAPGTMSDGDGLSGMNSWKDDFANEYQDQN